MAIIYPPIQIVDQNDQPIGQATMDEIHQQGLLHRIVLIIVVDEAGQILLQKRGPHVATYANYWDFSAAGHVDAGEDYETAARRELREELGLQGYELAELFAGRKKNTVDGRILNRFYRLYKVLVPTGTAIITEPTELTEARWFDPPGIQKLIEDQREAITEDLITCLRTYYF